MEKQLREFGKFKASWNEEIPRRITASLPAINRMKKLGLNIDNFIDAIQQTMIDYDFNWCYISIQYGHLHISLERWTDVTFLDKTELKTDVQNF